MRRMKYVIIFVCLLLICVVFVIFAQNIVPDKDIQKIQTTTITQKNTLVTLLHLARTTSYSKERVLVTEEGKGQLYAIPGVYTEFLIEYLGEAPIDNLSMSSPIQFWVNGKQIIELDTVVGGGTGVAQNYNLDEVFGFIPPVVENKDRSRLIKESTRGIILPSGKVEIRIEVGFNNEKEWFVFKNIPVY